MKLKMHLETLLIVTTLRRGCIVSLGHAIFFLMQLLKINGKVALWMKAAQLQRELNFK